MVMVVVVTSGGVGGGDISSYTRLSHDCVAVLPDWTIGGDGHNTYIRHGDD
jgi:hypothetical protein